MHLSEIRWDVRALFSILEPISLLYLFFLGCTAIWVIAALLSFLRWIRRVQLSDIQAVKPIQAKLAAQQLNLCELLLMAALLFGFTFFMELTSALRGWEYDKCNPQADVVGPFDGLLSVSQLTFGVFALIQCVRWYMSAKFARIRRDW